jgi:hypothetical protein
LRLILLQKEFNFTNVIGAEPDKKITSSVVPITEVDPATPVSANNGAVILVNGVAASTIGNNDKLSVQLKSSKLFGETVTTTVTVGSVSKDFSVTTIKEPKLSISLNPAVLSLGQGGSKTTIVTIARENFDDTVAITAQNLPNGVSVGSLSIAAGATSGQLSLTASQDATIVDAASVIINASGAGKTASQTLKLSVVAAVAEPLKISGYSNIEAIIGKAIATQTPVISGGSKPYSISIAPVLPAGLSVNAATGEIAGAATIAQAKTAHTVTVQDSEGQTASTSIDVTVNPAFAVVKPYNTVRGTIGYPIKFPGKPSLRAEFSLTALVLAQ